MKNSLGRDLLLAALSAIVVVAATAGLRRQGLDLLNGGQWLLCAWVLQQGGHLYREIFTRQGPLDAELLRAFFLLAGTRAASLALLKAFFDGLAAGAVFLGARRLGAGRWAFLAPLGVFALGPFPPRFILATVAAVILSLAIAGGGRRMSQSMVALAGLLAGLSALGGLDSLGLVLLLAVFAPRDRRPRLFRALALLPLLVALGFALGNGTLPAAVDQLAGGAATRLVDQLERIPPTRLVHTFVRAENAPSPFTLLKTGEILPPVLPASPTLRAWSWRLRLLLLLGIVVWAWRRPARWGPEALPLLVVASAPWMGILLRGNASFVDTAWLGGLVFLPLLLESGAGRGFVQTKAPGAARHLLILLLVALLFGPALVENTWLALHPHREGLHWWKGRSAGIALSSGTLHGLHKLYDQLLPGVRAGQEPMLVWPASPGINFLVGAKPALPQTLLLPERIRHPRELAEQLKAAAPHLVLLGLSWDFTGRRIEELAPGCWDHLREHYRVLDNLAQAPLKLRILQRLGPNETAEELPLPARLPDVEQTVANGESPAIRKNLEVGQSFLVGPRDLRGFAVRWRTRKKDLTVPLRIRIWMQQGGRWNSLAESYDIDAKIAGDLHRSYFRFSPVKDSANRKVAITFEAREELEIDLRLLWHRHGASDAPVDFYPEGTAMIDMEPTSADLYFLSW